MSRLTGKKNCFHQQLNVTHHVRMEENAVHLATALVLLGGVEQDVTEVLITRQLLSHVDMHLYNISKLYPITRLHILILIV